MYWSLTPAAREHEETRNEYSAIVLAGVVDSISGWPGGELGVFSSMGRTWNLCSGARYELTRGLRCWATWDVCRKEIGVLRTELLNDIWGCLRTMLSSETTAANGARGIATVTTNRSLSLICVAAGDAFLWGVRVASWMCQICIYSRVQHW